MRQIVITRQGGPEVLQIRELPTPEPKANEVRIQVKAAGINFADILARQGLYPDAPPLPCVVGYEVAGVVSQVGRAVAREWEGQSVLALTRFGGYSDQLVVPVEQVFQIPVGLDFKHAAAIPVNYLTAYQLVVVMGSLKAGETILIQNAGGGVGLAALDLARQIGATTYGTASPHKHDFLRQRGLNFPLPYHSPDWFTEVQRLTEQRGIDLILDPIGGRNVRLSYRSLRSTGRLGMYGVSAASGKRGWPWVRLLRVVLPMPWFHPVGLMNANKGVFGANLGHLWHEIEKVREWMRAILQGVQTGALRPHVDRGFPFTAVAEAHTYMEKRQNLGKVILIP
ncbi:medium chain dehydrogenase/reductase family protein [candidate division KSB1 bacterium]|nr:medium chain dehydrogenase/reductase family protein [candidate division KSB1 bacterium]